MRSLLLGGLAEARRHVGGDAVVMGYCFGGAAVLELARSSAGPDIKTNNTADKIRFIITSCWVR